MSDLAGRRILILEEQASIAQHLTDMLRGFGCKVIGPAKRVTEALALLAERHVDAAIIDVKVRGTPSYKVADALISRNIPWAFASANDTTEYARRHPGVPAIAKPYSSGHIHDVLDHLLASPGKHIGKLAQKIPPPSPVGG